MEIHHGTGRERVEQERGAAVTQSGSSLQETKLFRAWEQLRIDWLIEKTKPNTRDAYRTSVDQWLNFLEEKRSTGDQVFPWSSTFEHALEWKALLFDQNLKPATVNLRLNACKSWYRFVIYKSQFGSEQEKIAFRDALGNVRANPFHHQAVPRVPGDGPRTRMLSVDEVRMLLSYLKGRSHTKAGSRDLALVYTLIVTGWQVENASQILRLSWQDIEFQAPEHSKIPITPRCYELIVNYLVINGRSPDSLHPFDLIWRRQNVRGLSNLVRRPEDYSTNDAISVSRLGQIVKSSLSNAGIENPDECSIEDMRALGEYLFVNGEYADRVTLDLLLSHREPFVAAIFLADKE